MSFFQQLEDKNHLQTFTQLQHLFVGVDFMTQGIKLDQKLHPQRFLAGLQGEKPSELAEKVVGDS